MTPPKFYIPFVALPPARRYPSAPVPSPTPVVLPAGTPACQPDQVEAAYAGSGGATGHLVQQVRLRNKSESRCFLDGYPAISIVDRNGLVLAHVAGALNRGTWFDEGWSGPVLLSTDTPALPISTGSPVTDSAATGQAFLNVEWYECTGRPAAQLHLSLTSGGGEMAIPFPVNGPFGAWCDGGAGDVSLFRGPITPARWTPAGPHYRSNQISLTAPASVARGATLVYYATLTNTDVDAYSLDPCADYNEFVGAKDAWASYQLACSEVGVIEPGGSVAFQVELQIPTTAPTGAATLTWALIDGRFAIPTGKTTIDITA